MLDCGVGSPAAVFRNEIRRAALFSLKSLLDESRCGRLSVYRRTAKILIKKTIYSFPLFTSDEFFWSFYGLLSGFAVFN